jgi:hypothetical protein
MDAIIAIWRNIVEQVQYYVSQINTDSTVVFEYLSGSAKGFKVLLLLLLLYVALRAEKRRILDSPRVPNIGRRGPGLGLR